VEHGGLAGPGRTDHQHQPVVAGDVRAAQRKFYWATDPKIEAFTRQTCAAIAGRDVLEIGCSSGIDAEVYSQHCRRYVGVDLSDAGIRKAIDRNLPDTEFHVCDAHKLPFADQFFDAVIVNSLLHHLDLEVALGEISRVLRRGGLLILREPLGTNPAFGLYRLMTPSARTVDERPFTFGDLRLLAGFFRPKAVTFFGFLSVASAFARFPAVRGALTALDDLLAGTPLKYLYWQFSGVYEKVE
jgi:SAM-dependent methyltransferase